VLEKLVLAVALVVLAGLLAGILIALVGLEKGGIPIKLAGPIVIQGSTTPQELKVTLSIPQTVSIDAGGRAEANLRTTFEGIPCPHCHKGVMVPVKWNPFTGEVVWQCTSCGYTLESKAK